MTSAAPYDAIIVGAGMSGLAAGIRLAMFGKKVVILEKHSIAGGLNSYYQRRNFEEGGVRPFDVGLHALTNFIKKGERGKPFSILLKQLRIPYEDFKLHPQGYSLIDFPDAQLKFSNDFELLRSEVAEKFSKSIDEFDRFVKVLQDFNERSLDHAFTSARARIKELLSDPLLGEMLLAPTMIYGSSWEDDIDWAQFVVMFKSLYFEGFSRPEGGVRRILSLLMDKYKNAGGEIRFRASVSKILTHNNQCVGVQLADGQELRASMVFSSMGLPETVARLEDKYPAPARVGKMSFMESIFVYDRKLNMGPTIVFHSGDNHYNYRQSTGLFDPRSALVCCPDNYEPHVTEGEGSLRVSHIANYDLWRELERPRYDEEKEKVAEEAKRLLKRMFPDFQGQLRFTDVFSPTTVERYTWHTGGTVYGSPDKTRDGRTPVKDLFIIGTDQGFVGIVGAILSGISMANLHGLMQAEAT